MNKSKNNVNRDVNYKDTGTRIGRIIDKNSSIFPSEKRNGVLNNNFIKRCGYLLASMKISEFIKLGGSKINNSELYYIEKKYDGTPTGEVCAILGIRKKELLELIKSNKLIRDLSIEDKIYSIENKEEKKRETKIIKESFNSLNKIDKIYEIRDNKVFKIEDKNGNILYDKDRDDRLLKDISLEKKNNNYEYSNRYENLNEDKILYSNKDDSDDSDEEEKDSYSILSIIKNFNGFNNIDNIKNLNIDNIIDPVIHFINHINQFEDDYLFIFNIEPKGQTKRQLKYYPNPNICIPGGNMEKKDLLSYELCAIREFEEETGIKIRNNYEILMTYNIQIKKYKSNKELNSFKSNLKNNRRSVPGIHSNKYIEKSCSFPTSTFFKRFDLKDIKYQYERHYFFVKIN